MVIKKILLKLGGRCNWTCPHCHNETKDCEFNPAILDYIRANGYEKVSFSGGEPTLYWNIITKVCEALGHGYQYAFVTNGSLIDQRKLSLIEKYNIRVCVSYDGTLGRRCGKPDIQWEAISYINDLAISSCVYKANMNLPRLVDEVDVLSFKHRLRRKITIHPEFIHKTAAVEADCADRVTAAEYCRQMAGLIEPELIAMAHIDDIETRKAYYAQCGLVRKAVWKWWAEHDTRLGCRCFNENLQAMTVSGKFLLCPYTDRYDIGDIYTGIKWNKVEEYLPARCRSCAIKKICRGACFANVTEEECYISKTMNRWLDKVIARYGLNESFQQFNEELKW